MKRLPIVLSFLLSAMACDGSAPADDAGVDASRADASPPVTDAGRDATVDAGPPRPRALDLDWVVRVESAQVLAGLTDAELSLMPGGGFAMTVSLGGAPAVFGPGEPNETTVGAEEGNTATPAIAYYNEDGTLQAARSVALPEPEVLEGYRATAYAIDTHTDGSVTVGGRYHAAARFGGNDPGAQLFVTVLEEIEPMVFAISDEAFLARFDSSRSIQWARRSVSDTGLADHVITDIDVLSDGSTVAIGAFMYAAVLGFGEDNQVRLLPTPPVEDREVFLARFDADGDLLWARETTGLASPTRITALADGSFIVLLRYSTALTLGVGEENEVTLPEPPAGTLACDAIARFDPDGRLVWATRMESDATSSPGLRDLWVAEDGSMVVGGSVRGNVSWPDTPDFQAYNAYGQEGMVAHLDPNGTVVWHKRIRAFNSLQVQAVAPDGSDTWVLATVSPHA